MIRFYVLRQSVPSHAASPLLASTTLKSMARTWLHRLSLISRPALMAGLLLAACNSTDTLPRDLDAANALLPDYGSHELAVATPEAAVLSAGMTRIAEVYFRPLDVGHMTMDGLNALKTLDEHIDFQRHADMLSVLVNQHPISQISLPASNDAEDWAKVASLALEAAHQRAPFLASLDRELVLETMFDAMISHNLDRFSRYASARNGSRERGLREGFGGVGMAFEHSDGKFIITGVFPDGPAVNAGLQNGDVIRSIDGLSTDQMTLTRLRDMLRGRVGTFVMLDIERDGKIMRDRSVLRERVIANTVIDRADDGIGIVTIERFNAATSAHVHAAITLIRQKLGDNFKGLVLDLRGNPGGLLEQAVEVADMFISHGRIIRTAGRHPESFQDFAAHDGDLINGAPLVVLVDGGSASAAEVVGAALQESGRAVVVGSASYGKGSVQTVTRLPNDGELFVTWSEIFTPQGHGLHQIGILPNICTSNTQWHTDDSQQLLQLANDARPTRSIWVSQQTASGSTGDRSIYASIAAAGRTACPPVTADPAQDQELARLLIDQPGLLARIAGTDQPVIAASQPPVLQASAIGTVGDLR